MCQLSAFEYDFDGTSSVHVTSFRLLIGKLARNNSDTHYVWFTNTDEIIAVETDYGEYTQGVDPWMSGRSNCDLILE